MRTSFLAQTNARAAASEPASPIVISPNVLDFGLVGVGRTKDLTLTVQNVGGGALKGTVAAAGPFSVVGGGYSLKGGQSKPLTVRYQPSSPGTNSGTLTFSGAGAAQVPVIGWARIPPPPPRNLRALTAEDEKQTDFIVRYTDDRTSYVLKPPMMEGQFRTICPRDRVLKAAADQPRRDQALVVLIHYTDLTLEQDVKVGWVKALEKLGYKRVLFCRSRNGLEVIGLPVVGASQVTSL